MPSTQELAFEVSNANNNKFSTEYGSNPVLLEMDGPRQLEASKNPLTYIANWNGSFFDNKLLTRWSWGIQTQAQHKYSRMLVLGQQLNLPKIQLYFDYMGALDGLDRLKIASSEATAVPAHPGESYFSDVLYNSFITKMNWQFAPQWNLMLKDMYENSKCNKDRADEGLSQELRLYGQHRVLSCEKSGFSYLLGIYWSQIRLQRSFRLERIQYKSH